MSDFLATADLVDSHDDQVRLCQIQWRWFGRRRGFHGQAVTLKCFEDNSLIRAALSEAGHGKVLVVDGAGSLRCALVGDQIAALGQRNGWAGVIINGAIRDGDALDGMDFAVLARGRAPKKSAKTGQGWRDVPVTFGEVTFTPGAMVYADGDGVLVADAPLDL